MYNIDATTARQLYQLAEKRESELTALMQNERDLLVEIIGTRQMDNQLVLDLHRAITNRFNPRFNKIDTFKTVLFDLLQITQETE